MSNTGNRTGPGRTFGPEEGKKQAAAASGGAKQNRRQIGSAYEGIAEAFLKERGLEIWQRNFRDRFGEIDLIAWDPAARELVFCEVKYRRSAAFGSPEAAVNASKQERIRHTARYFLHMRQMDETTPCRFDVIAIEGSTIRWVKDAFV